MQGRHIVGSQVLRRTEAGESTIRRAHRILVLDQGRVAESGTHDELMEKRGFYYNLYKLQYEKKATAT